MVCHTHTVCAQPFSKFAAMRDEWAGDTSHITYRITPHAQSALLLLLLPLLLMGLRSQRHVPQPRLDPSASCTYAFRARARKPEIVTSHITRSVHARTPESERA